MANEAIAAAHGRVEEALRRVAGDGSGYEPPCAALCTVAS
jgi:hypothetical protein